MSIFFKPKPKPQRSTSPIFWIAVTLVACQGAALYAQATDRMYLTTGVIKQVYVAPRTVPTPVRENPKAQLASADWLSEVAGR